MKMIRWIILTVASCLMPALAAAGKNMEKDYIVDQYVGRNEQVIVKEFGKPKSISTFFAKDMVDPLQAPIRKELFAHRPNTRVRKLYYQTKKGETIFWLKEKSGQWVVVTDIWIAPGVQF